MIPPPRICHRGASANSLPPPALSQDDLIAAAMRGDDQKLQAAMDAGGDVLATNARGVRARARGEGQKR